MSCPVARPESTGGPVHAGERFENRSYDVPCPCHPFGERLPIAKATIGRYADPDYALAMGNTGKNGRFTAFSRQG